MSAATSPANVAAHWRYVSSEIIKYARDAEKTNDPFTAGMNVRGLTKVAQQIIKTSVAKKRAANKAKALCKAVSAPGNAGVKAYAAIWRQLQKDFSAGIDLTAPLKMQHAWDIYGYLDFVAMKYAYAFCPAQEAWWWMASDLSASAPDTTVAAT